MVPAHYVVEIQLIGCPDPDPTYTRFFTPERNALPPDLDEIGRRYIGALADEIAKWLQQVPEHESLGVCFSGGIDSGAVFLTTYHVLRKLGMSPARLKAFTLDCGGGADLAQARAFLEPLSLGLFLEPIESSLETLDIAETIRVLEDYKPLDVQCASMGLLLCRGIRQRYPEWRFLLDGDGGDENLKDYPIEENPELTIRSVVNNLMLYQEGWGVGRIKHSLTYSGGLSRSYTRTYAPARHYCFEGFSPFTRPDVLTVAEGIPFDELTHSSVEKLYALKGEIVARGVGVITGLDMPTFPKAPVSARCVADRSVASTPARRGSRVSPAVPGALRVSANRSVDCGSLQPMTSHVYPDSPRERNEWILARRPERNVVDPRRPQAFLVEDECDASGTVMPVATIFLTNRECPWRCLMCDLWRNTLVDSVPVGAIPEQIEFALRQLPPARHIKLYNSGSFFDRRAIPPEDFPAIAEQVREFERVIVECHPALIGDAALRFRDLLAGHLEIAMGLETAHPIVLEKLNKRMTLAHFAQAAEFLRAHDISLRVFVLVKPPFLDEAEAIEWARRSADFAFDCGAEIVSLIPTRAGNGALDALMASGEFAAPATRHARSGIR
jgi:radical SAM enzyme (TIGR01210 family)